MKINSKKQMNLPQLIEWGFNNPNLVKGKLFLTKEHEEYSPYVQFSVDGYGVRTSQSISNDDTFTVEVEEEITEDTVIPKMLLRGRYTGYYEIEDCKLRGFNENLLQAYILNNDLTMTLIWRDGKLVE
ncbi:hypothetical protein [Staphylococcus saprophyticus]|uniref:hypothetical protein n=1 Tax=Staphylococcus saprophyticus TaxID=29385 RepID=UPI0011A0F87E|nr:hypothetical protein [Staphylococcus saprophyticus]